MNDKTSRAFLAAAGALWALSVAAGSGLLIRYERAPGAQATPARQWPAGVGFEPDSRRFTLVMLAHPRCPCTRASLRELAKLMAREPGRLTAEVLFFRPEGASETWAHTNLWRAAAEIPGVQVRSDEGGQLARNAFHAATSGQTLLYDAEGRLLFRGGITAARGHEGDNTGESAIRALLAGQGGTQTVAGTAPVFGCSLFAPAEGIP